MATFPQNIEAIRTAVLGREVRAAIADSLEQTYNQYQSVEEYAEQMSVLKYIDVQLRDTNGYLWGDVDGDGSVGNTDLLIVANYVQGTPVNPRGDGTTAWKSCVNFDTSSSDITNADRAILASLISQKKSTKDVIVRYVLEYEDEHKVYLWGVVSGEFVSVAADAALSPTSTNPIQNKAVYDAIGDIASVLASL